MTTATCSLNCHARSATQVLLSFVLFLPTWFASAGSLPPPGYTAIPDPIFEQRLIALGIDSQGGPPDGQVLTSDIAAVVSLNVSFSGINSLSGIEDFDALQTLIATNNNLTSLNVSQNPQLADLRVGLNDLEQLNVSNNPSLMLLYANGNRLQTLDVSNNPALQSLRVQTQQAGFRLATLRLGSIQNLAELFVQGNDLNDTLRVQNLFALSSFNATNNPNLRCIEVSNVAAANAGVGIYAGWSKDPMTQYSELCGGNIDLRVLMTLNATPPLTAGKSIEYMIDVDNLSADARVEGAAFSFSAPTTLTDVSWQCVADPGSICPGSGTGLPDHLVTLAGGSGLGYTVSGTVALTAPDNSAFNSTASISIGSPWQDINATNNNATVLASVSGNVIFGSGFEQP